jgi:hypothetical protein
MIGTRFSLADRRLHDPGVTVLRRRFDLGKFGDVDMAVLCFRPRPSGHHGSPATRVGSPAARAAVRWAFSAKRRKGFELQAGGSSPLVLSG